MKIISGLYKGRTLKGYDMVGTRPTMDRVKESVFAMIQCYVKDAVVLDLYSGTGNLAIEAISNGAKEAYLVDNNKIAINMIKDNIKTLNVVNTNIIHGDAINTLKSFINEGKVFDVIFLDPPYNTNEIDKSLTIINDSTNLLSDNGLIVCETELNIDYSKYQNLIVYKCKKYGSKTVNILKRKNKTLTKTRNNDNI